MDKNKLYSFFENEDMKLKILSLRPIDIFNLLSKNFNLQNISLDERNFYLQIIISFQKNYEFMQNL